MPSSDFRDGSSQACYYSSSQKLLGKDFNYNKNKIIPSDMPIVVNLDVMLARRKMTLTELSEKVGITIANLSILKSGKARAIMNGDLSVMEIPDQCFFRS